MEYQKERGNNMKTIVNQANGIVINVDNEMNEIHLSHIQNSVAFTITIPTDSSEGVIEKWLCMHMSENDCAHSYEKVVKELNEVLKLYMPEKRRYQKTYETKYVVDGIVEHISKCGERYESVDMGNKLAVGEAESISIVSDEYRVSVTSEMELEIYEATTEQLVFQFPIDTKDFDQLTILGLFKEDCLDYLKKFSSLKLGKVSDPAKRALVINASSRYHFHQDTLERLVRACIKYDELTYVPTNHNGHVIGFLPNSLWTYCGTNHITMWAYNSMGSEVERISFDA